MIQARFPQEEVPRDSGGGMTEPCHEENHACETSPSCATRLRLDDARCRFDAEAKRGECDTGRYLCRYYDWGKGPPLVFVHGLCDDARSFLLPMTRLSEHFRCIAYELPVGRDDGARLSNYRHHHFVDDLLALIDHLKLPEAYLFGSSFGSTISMVAMHREPKRFLRAVLQGGFARRPLATAEILLARWARYWPWNMNQLPFRVEVLKSSHAGPFGTQPPEVWDFFLDRDSGNPMGAIAHRALILHETDIRHLLAEIAQPVLMVCGECDSLVGKPCEEELLRGLPNALRIEIEGCGHMPQFTHPEILADVSKRFLLAT